MAPQILQCTAPDVYGLRKTHLFELAIPESCSGQSEKLANFRRHRKELAAEQKEIERIASRYELVSKARLVTAIVMETSISFLDLAAAIFEPINPAAAKAAARGVATVRATKSLGELMTREKNFGQFAVSVTQEALNVAAQSKKYDNTMSLALLAKARTHVSAVGVAVEQASGASADEVKKSGIDLAKGTLTDSIAVVGSALSESGYSKTAKVISVFGVIDGIFEATSGYNTALGQHIETRIQDAQWARDFRRNQSLMLSRLVARIDKGIEIAEGNLDSCIANGSGN